MIDYTQDAFAHPGLVLDPIPSIGDYLDDYQARNEAWYQSFAFPLGDGRYGARPSSFERRGLPPAAASQVEPDPAALPPIIQDGPIEDNRVLAGDRPAGALVRDVNDMTKRDILAEAAALSGPYGRTGQVAASIIGPPIISTIAGQMAMAGVNDRLDKLFNQAIGMSLGSAEGQGGIPDLFGSPDAVSPVVDYESGSHQGGPSGPGQDTYQGGEVGAGGWAGPGGL